MDGWKDMQKKDQQTSKTTKTDEIGGKRVWQDAERIKRISVSERGMFPGQRQSESTKQSQ